MKLPVIKVDRCALGVFNEEDILSVTLDGRRHCYIESTWDAKQPPRLEKTAFPNSWSHGFDGSEYESSNPPLFKALARLLHQVRIDRAKEHLESLIAKATK